MIRLVLSILAPVLFLANYWVCEFMFPGSDKDWAIFIPMDMLCHNFWAGIIFVYAIGALFPITKQITYYFIWLSAFLSFFDVTARYFGMADYVAKWYILSLTLSLILAGISYGIQFGKHASRTRK